MASYAIKDTVVTLNSVVITDYVASIAWNETASTNEVETIGVSNVQRTAGKTDGSVTLEILTDFAASASYATLKSLLGTVVTLLVNASSVAASVTNPGRSVDVVITDWSFMDGASNEFSTYSVTWPFATAPTAVEA